MQKSFFFFQSPQSTALQQPHARKAQSKAKRGSAHDIADMVHAGQHTANTDEHRDAHHRPARLRVEIHPYHGQHGSAQRVAGWEGVSPGLLVPQRFKAGRRSTAVYAPPEVVDGKPPVYPYTPIRSSFENAGSIEEMMLYTELQSAVHAMIQRLEYSFTFNPSLLTSPKRKQQVTEILEEAEKYIWRIKEEMRCA